MASPSRSPTRASTPSVSFSRPNAAQLAQQLTPCARSHHPQDQDARPVSACGEDTLSGLGLRRCTSIWQKKQHRKSSCIRSQHAARSLHRRGKRSTGRSCRCTPRQCIVIFYPIRRQACHRSTWGIMVFRYTSAQGTTHHTHIFNGVFPVLNVPHSIVLNADRRFASSRLAAVHVKRLGAQRSATTYYDTVLSCCERASGTSHLHAFTPSG